MTDGTTVEEDPIEREGELVDPENASKKWWGLGITRWFLLTGNRRLVTLVFLGLVFAALVAAGVVRPFQMRDLIAETGIVRSLFITLLSGVILLVSIVVSINSVVLSQELGSLGTHQQRIDESTAFRDELEELAGGEVSPSKADHFLGFVLETLQRRASGLQESVANHPNDALRTEVNHMVNLAKADLNAIDEYLSIHNLERPNVLLAGQDFQYAGQLFSVRYVWRHHGNDLDRDQKDALEAYSTALDAFAASREYFKNLFYQREMAYLSSTLLYVSLPVIVFTSYVLLALDEQLFPDVSLLGLPVLLVFVSLAFTVVLAPYLVLTSYIIRAAFVARRSLESGPFNAREDVSQPEVDLEE